MARWLALLLVGGVALSSGLTSAYASGASLEGRVVANPLSVGVSLSQDTVEQGEAFTVSASVANEASYALLDVRLELRSDGDLVVVGDSNLVIGQLPGLGRHEASWTVCAPQAGNYLVVAAAAAVSPDGQSFVAESRAHLVEVVAGGEVCGGFVFTGFLAPVDNPPTLNLATAGAALPLKFSLGGDQGLEILASGYPASAAVSCESRSSTDAIEETSTAGSSSLSYDRVSDVYTYVWKTERRWADSCRQLVLVLSDGTLHRAEFKFRR